MRDVTKPQPGLKPAAGSSGWAGGASTGGPTSTFHFVNPAGGAEINLSIKELIAQRKMQREQSSRAYPAASMESAGEPTSPRNGATLAQSARESLRSVSSRSLDGDAARTSAPGPSTTPTVEPEPAVSEEVPPPDPPEPPPAAPSRVASTPRTEEELAAAQAAALERAQTDAEKALARAGGSAASLSSDAGQVDEAATRERMATIERDAAAAAGKAAEDALRALSLDGTGVPEADEGGEQMGREGGAPPVGAVGGDGGAILTANGGTAVSTGGDVAEGGGRASPMPLGDGTVGSGSKVRIVDPVTPPPVFKDRSGASDDSFPSTRDTPVMSNATTTTDRSRGVSSAATEASSLFSGPEVGMDNDDFL